MNPSARRGPRRPPIERVRLALARVAGPELAATLPTGYQRLGRVLVVRWPAVLRPFFPLLAEAFRQELGVVTVLRRTGPIEGELRTPALERLAGTETETEVVEHGIRWTFDAARVMFAAGNRTERRRAGEVTRPGEVVVDLFAGIGYFAIPAAKKGDASRVLAVDRNPVSVRYLTENARRNGVAERIDVRLGDNREMAFPLGVADRVFLGYLPSALPWVARALPLLKPRGGWLHVHLVVDARDAVATAERLVVGAVSSSAGSTVEPPEGREVKPYGPGRTHVVVDAHVRPAAS